MRQSELPHVHTVTLHVVLDYFRNREALVITKLGTGKKWLRIEDWHIMWYLHGGTRFRLEDWRDQEWHWLANGTKESLIVGAILCMQWRALAGQEMLQITRRHLIGNKESLTTRSSGCMIYDLAFAGTQKCQELHAIKPMCYFVLNAVKYHLY